jgi:hypothetical protein
MTNEDLDIQQQELRKEVRTAASEFASIEFKPSTAALTYHFKLRDFSHSGLGLFVKKDSDLLNNIKVGDILPAKYHKGIATEPQQLRVEIRHISTPANGKPENHVIVGLLFLEKLVG